jgi:hypothetical protein
LAQLVRRAVSRFFMTVVLLWIDRGDRSQVASLGADGISQRQDWRQIGRMMIWLSASVASASDLRRHRPCLGRERMGDYRREELIGDIKLKSNRSRCEAAPIDPRDCAGAQYQARLQAREATQ